MSSLRILAANDREFFLCNFKFEGWICCGIKEKNVVMIKGREMKNIREKEKHRKKNSRLSEMTKNENNFPIHNSHPYNGEDNFRWKNKKFQFKLRSIFQVFFSIPIPR